MRFPMSHIVGCDDSKPRNCNTCLLESSRSITARSLVGATKSTSNCGRNVMDLPDVTIVHLAPEEFNYTVSVFRRIFHYEINFTPDTSSMTPGRAVGLPSITSSSNRSISDFSWWVQPEGGGELKFSNSGLPVIWYRHWSCKAPLGYRKAASRVLHGWFRDNLQEHSLQQTSSMPCIHLESNL